MKTITRDEILAFESRYRANLINTLSGIKSANLIGSIDSKGLTNLSIISSTFHLGSNPALIGFIMRPPSESRQRHTLDNIIEMREFTINHINKDIINKAHQTSARYEKEESEFEMVGLTPDFNKNFKAPAVKESHLKIFCKLEESLFLEINKTTMIIGQIHEIHLNEENLQSDGSLNINDSIALTGLDTYHQVKFLKRLSYAKKDKELQEFSRIN